MRATLSSTYDYRIHHKETGAVWKLSSLFLQHIPFDTQDLIFFCIGTDRSTGDSLGPLTGSFLSESSLFPFTVIGTLESPLHALNLQQYIDETRLTNPSAFIVAIDACLGQVSSIGQLLFNSGPIHPGKAVGKDLPPVGDVSIKGIVNIAGFMEHAVLQSTRLYLPYEMSRTIARALQLAHGRRKSKEVNDSNSYSNDKDTRNQISNSHFSQTN
ncbi:spore protease YyaC [Sporosarcina sp. E16_8]|uniref:spore protease YyaC n=1 Tax=Sporosarcina sp. E16_8 TaxID=2789295 RepID=UPI001A936C37|nr:spore protease YyaC [Sporosarcina sp. E16_8]MBO0587554.1 spore protease YyaC [Sporosarcina sp. E16_8]